MKSSDNLIIKVRVTARAANNLVKLESCADNLMSFKVYVTVPPEDGLANDAVLKLISKYIKVPKTALLIARGIKSRDKIIITINN